MSELTINFELNFDFVDDPKVQEILRRYFDEACRAYQGGAYLGAIVSSGGVVEGILTWALLKRKDEATKQPKAQKDRNGSVIPLEDWGLTSLISVAMNLGLIGEARTRAAWAVKDFRNLIHPYNLGKSSLRPDQSLALNALTAVDQVVKSLEGRVHDGR